MGINAQTNVPVWLLDWLETQSVGCWIGLITFLRVKWSSSTGTRHGSITVGVTFGSVSRCTFPSIQPNSSPEMSGYSLMTVSLVNLLGFSASKDNVSSLIDKIFCVCTISTVPLKTKLTLETWTSTLDPRASILETFEDRVSSIESQVSRIESRGSRNKAFSNMEKTRKGFEKTIYFSKEE